MPDPQTHLLVDGSNVVQAWADTRVLARRDREAAKALLLRRVAVLHDFSAWRVTVVFDGRGDDLRIEAVGDSEGFSCVHTPVGVTADDVIEQLVGRAAAPGCCLVATADQAERVTVEAAGAPGATRRGWPDVSIPLILDRRAKSRGETRRRSGAGAEEGRDGERGPSGRCRGGAGRTGRRVLVSRKVAATHLGAR